MKIYDFTVLNTQGEQVSLSEYKGKVLLIVNTATQCGFTPQYDGLQNLYERYKEQGFEILDFPCNQFGNQAPGTNEEIVSFCDANFGVTFDQFSKIDVNGDDASELFHYLKQEKGFAGFNPNHPLTPLMESMLEREHPDYKETPDIKWNFTKFLVDRTGNVAVRFEPTEEMEVIEAKVKELL